MARIYCSNCGTLIPETSNFCYTCGAPQHGQESALYRAQEKPIAQAVSPSIEVIQASHRPHAKMEREVVARRHLHPRAVWLFFLNYNMRMAIVLPIFAVGIYMEPLVTVFFVAYEFLMLMIASLVHSHFWFSIDEQGFEVEYGIIHKRSVSLPFRQIQNVNILRTLIDRLLGLAKLEVETAGSSNTKHREVVGGIKSKAEGILPGITMADASHFHDLLLLKKEHQHANGD